MTSKHDRITVIRNGDITVTIVDFDHPPLINIRGMVHMAMSPKMYIDLYRTLTEHIKYVPPGENTELGQEIKKYLAEQKGGSNE